MQFHQYDGHTGEVLGESDASLRDHDDGERGGRTDRIPRSAGEADGEDRGHDQPDQQHGRIRVQLGDACDIEPETPRRGRVPAVWARPGDHCADDERRAGDEREHPGQPAQLRPTGGAHRAFALPGPAVEHDDVQQQHHRQQEVPGYQGGMQFEQHGQPAEHHLAEKAEPQAEGESDEVRPAFPKP